MSYGEKLTTRVKISIENLIFEFEGTEEFVTARLQEYKEQILGLIPNQFEQDRAKLSGQTETKPRDKTTRKPPQEKARRSAQPKTKPAKISAERFDIHGGENCCNRILYSRRSRESYVY